MTMATLYTGEFNECKLWIKKTNRRQYIGKKVKGALNVFLPKCTFFFTVTCITQTDRGCGCFPEKLVICPAAISPNNTVLLIMPRYRLNG